MPQNALIYYNATLIYEYDRNWRKNDTCLKADGADQAKPFFENKDEQEAFIQRHPKKQIREIRLKEGETLRAYLGIDSGSTTTKFVLINEEEEISA